MTQQQEQFISANRHKKTIPEIVEELGIASHFVYNHYKKNGWKGYDNRNVITKEYAEIIKYNEGKSLYQITAAVYGENFTANDYARVKSHCKKYGIYYSKLIVRKGKNIFLPIVVPDESKEFKRPVAVYSNPDYSKMYL